MSFNLRRSTCSELFPVLLTTIISILPGTYIGKDGIAAVHSCEPNSKVFTSAERSKYSKHNVQYLQLVHFCPQGNVLGEQQEMKNSFLTSDFI